MRDVAVVGLGLIGGSLLRRLADGWSVVGYDHDPAARAAAGAAGFRVTPTIEVAVASADLVVVAVPVPQLPALLPGLAVAMRAEAVLTDVASVKRPVHELVSRVAPRIRFVGGHPMAGTERSGFGASDRDLFAGAPWVLCLDGAEADPRPWLAVAEVVTRIGARVVPTTAAEHDDAVARISHLPHVLAAVLAEIGAAGGPLALRLAAGSFRDGTRVAATRPELSAAMCVANADALTPVVTEALGRLAAFQDELSDRESATGAFRHGYVARTGWQDRADDTGDEVTTDPASPALRTWLAELGRSGGYLDAVTAETLRGWSPRAYRQ